MDLMKKLLPVFIMLMTFSGQGYTHQGLNVENLVTSGNSWDGSSLPKTTLNTPEISVLKITIPPHSALPVHKHPVINAGYLLKGELVVVKKDDGQELHLKAGDALIELVESWHFGENRTNQPAEIVVFYVGNKGEQLTLKEAEQLPVL